MSFGQYSSTYAPAKPALPTKTKRIKTVFGPHDTGVEHVWAHPQTSGTIRKGKEFNSKYPKSDSVSGFEQTFATNPQRNFYFKTHEDNTRVLYSYRDSYPIGARFQVKKRIVFLVRSGKPYSSTTAQHMSACANAARNNGEVFYVPFVIRHDIANAVYDDPNASEGKPDKATHAENLKDFASRIQESIDEYIKARAVYRIENSRLAAIALTKEAKQYAKVFGLKLPKLPAVPKLDADRLAKARANEATRDARKAEAKERRAAQFRLECAELIAKWKNGEDVSLPYGLGQYALLRVRNGNVETSQRVTVPISGPTGAARLLRFLEACKASGRTYQSNGHSERVGQFIVTSFQPQVMKGIDPHWVAESESAGVIKPQKWILVAGCHRILWSEVQSIADAVRDAENGGPQ